MAFCKKLDLGSDEESRKIINEMCKNSLTHNLQTDLKAEEVIFQSCQQEAWRTSSRTSLWSRCKRNMHKRQYWIRKPKWLLCFCIDCGGGWVSSWIGTHKLAWGFVLCWSIHKGHSKLTKQLRNPQDLCDSECTGYTDLQLHFPVFFTLLWAHSKQELQVSCWSVWGRQDLVVRAQNTKHWAGAQSWVLRSPAQVLSQWEPRNQAKMWADFWIVPSAFQGSNPLWMSSSTNWPKPAWKVAIPVILAEILVSVVFPSMNFPQVLQGN